MNAIDVFGSSDHPYSRGYIYEDGSFLDVGAGQDHRIINAAFCFDEDDEHEDIELPDSFPMSRDTGSYYMIAFMKYGEAIRYHVSNDWLMVSYIAKPSRKQIFAIDELIKEYKITEVKITKLNDEYRALKEIEGYTDDFEVMDQIHNLS
jgi:hypothetical protein